MFDLDELYMDLKPRKESMPSKGFVASVVDRTSYWATCMCHRPYGPPAVKHTT